MFLSICYDQQHVSIAMFAVYAPIQQFYKMLGVIKHGYPTPSGVIAQKYYLIIKINYKINGWIITLIRWKKML